MRKAASRFSQAFLLGIVLLLVLGCSGDNKEKKDDKGNKDQPPKEPAEKSKPDFSFTAQEFDEELKGNEMEKGQKYQDKVVQLRGVVKGFHRSSPDNVSIFLNRPSIPDLGFEFRSVDNHPWRKATPGQDVTIQGIYSIDGSFQKGVILAATGKPMPTLSAEELGAEYAADKKSADKKYKNKRLILTGEVAKTVADPKVDYLAVVLKTKGKVPVSCAFIGEDRKLAEKLKVGQQIKALGTYGSGPDEVGLFLCLLMEP